jgi:hypothetical protein
LSKLKWLLEKLADIAVSVIAGIVLYLILGGYISQPLSEISPHLPTLLTVSLVLTIVFGFFYRLFKSVGFHRFIERVSLDVIDFLQKWDKLHETLAKAKDSRKPKDVNKFEEMRTQLQYDYRAHRISSAVSFIRFGYIDRIQGVAIRNYDVIGNLLAESPFIKMREWLNVSYMYSDFTRDWDVGRTILVSTLGYFDKNRRSLIHRLYWMLRLVPFPEIEKQSSTQKSR